MPEGIQIDFFQLPDNPAADLFESDWIAPDEWDRAAAIRHEPTRAMFLFSRAKLRQCLCRLTDCPPENIHYEYDVYGKPQLPPTTGRPQVHFNISHSDQLLAIACSGNAPVGIDVQIHRKRQNYADLAQRFFSKKEIQFLSEAHDPSDYTALFYQIWVHKEAFVKAVGKGLRIPLQAFTVQPEAYSVYLPEINDWSEISKMPYSIQRLEPPLDGYSAAIAWQGIDGKLKLG